MGFDINTARFLIAAHKRGARFEQVLTIGRQDLNVYPTKMAKVLERAGLPFQAFKTEGKQTQFAEPLFYSLGAKKVSSVDVSDFEGAELVHDLNKPIPVDWRERFDAVC